MLYDVVIPILWALQILKVGNFNPSVKLLDYDSVIDDLFRVVFMDDKSKDRLDDRLQLITPMHSPVMNTATPYGNLCQPGVWCVYKTVYGML